MADFYLPMTGQDQNAPRALLIARRATIGWGVVQMLVAVVAINLSQRIVDEVLSISSFTNGLILGIFLLGRLGVRRQVPAYLGVTSGAIILLGIRLLTDVSWQWYVLIGATVTVVAGWAANRRPLGPS
ncbi:MAG: sodium:solute symporter, partial [Acidobacteriota bacterium]|nr:sodium:solute symporter [Acidobacteriota bacterium]